MRSHDIAAALFALVADLEDAGGEWTEDVEARFAALLDESDDKLRALQAFDRRSRVEVGECREREALAKADRRRWVAVGERCKRAATGLLQAREAATGGRAVPGVAHLRRGAVRVVGPTNVLLWREHGWVRTRHEPDRVAARADLERSSPAPDGFSLERGDDYAVFARGGGGS